MKKSLPLPSAAGDFFLQGPKSAPSGHYGAFLRGTDLREEPDWYSSLMGSV